MPEVEDLGEVPKNHRERRASVVIFTCGNIEEEDNTVGQPWGQRSQSSDSVASRVMGEENAKESSEFSGFSRKLIFKSDYHCG